MPDPSQNPGGEGGQNQGGEPQVPAWRASLPEALRGEKTFDKFNDPDPDKVFGKIAESYFNLEKHAGGAVRIPGENATPEERRAFYARLGVPEKPEGYGIEVKVPEGLPWDKAAEGRFVSKAHELGLTKAQVQGVLDHYLGDVQAAVTAQAQAKAATAESAYGEMQKEWGGLTDRNVALVQRVVKEFGGDEFAGYLDESGLGNDPRLMRFVHKVGGMLLEDNLIQGGTTLGITKLDAKAELDKIMTSPEYMKGDKATIERVRELAEVVHG